MGEFGALAAKQVRSCVFALFIFAMLALSHVDDGVPRRTKSVAGTGWVLPRS